MMQAIDRYMKQAIVDKVPAVASAALVSSLVWLPLPAIKSTDLCLVVDDEGCPTTHICST